MQVIPTIISIIALLLEFRVPRCYLIVGKWVRGVGACRWKGQFVPVLAEVWVFFYAARFILSWKRSSGRMNFCCFRSQ